MRPASFFMTYSVLAGLALALGYAVFRFGGVLAPDWHLSLFTVALLSLVYFVARREQAPRLDRPSIRLLLVFAALAVVQILPLPLFLVRLLSPARAGLVNGTDPILGWVSFTTLSATPLLTVESLLSLAGFVLVFLLVRDLSWQFEDHPWAPVWPLILIASLEAALGLTQYYLAGSDGLARGTYVNRDHFAGFLEMCLPFAVMYAVAVLRRNRSRYESPAGPALKACGLLFLATGILLGILLSLSRMGFLAVLVSLFAAGALALGAGHWGWKRWVPVGLFALVVILGFLFLPTDALISRFADLAASGEISADTRAQIWRNTLHLVRAFPLFGCGLGGYESCLLRYKTVAPMYTVDFAHNDYLQALAEMGIFAFAIGLLFLLRIFLHTLRNAIDEPDTDRRYLAQASIGSLVAIFLHSLVDFNLHIPANAMLLSWILGICAMSLSSPSRPGSNSLRLSGLRPKCQLDAISIPRGTVPLHFAPESGSGGRPVGAEDEGRAPA